MIGTRAKVVLGCIGALALAVAIGWASGEAKGQPKRTEAAGTQKAPPRLALPVRDNDCKTKFALRQITERDSAKTCQGLLPNDNRWRILSLSGTDQDVGTPWHASGNWEPLDGKTGKPVARLPLAAQKDKAAAADVYTQAALGFCVYEWAEKTTLPQTADFARIGAKPECGFSTGMAATPAPPSDILRERAAAFERHARGVRQTAWAGAAPTFARAVRHAGPRAFVAVVDASPFGATQPDRSGHGYAVSRVIADLACDKNPDCEKTVIRPYVALPRIRTSSGDWVEDFKQGGFVGYFHDLFRAFRKALADWEKDAKDAKDAHKPEPKLIINLSLGWDPIKTDPDSLENVYMQMLLERAYCRGVLVIAAAGNETGSEGAVMPAALESQAPPRCGASAPATIYRPLIHAVGAVDRYGERLALSRPWSEPRLVAYGSQVTVPTGAGQNLTPPLTGTSIAAAVVSGIAEVVWSARPRLDAAGVMTLIYESGDDLAPVSASRHARNRTEVCLPKPRRCDAWSVRRATLCGALKKLDPTAKMTCEEPEQLPDPLPKVEAPDAVEPCRLAECGASVGPNELQLPAVVMPMPGAATCATCEFKLGSSFGRRIGTAQGTPETVTGISTTVVRSKQSSSSFQDYPLSPVPVAGQPFAKSYVLSATPASAEMHWIFDVGIGTYVTTDLAITY
jgi:hypothetical protein